MQKRVVINPPVLITQTKVVYIPYAPAQTRVDFYRYKLPVIELPKFNGNYEKWLKFRDLFNFLIHKNQC